MFVFVDFEASGLAPDNWPIEAGVAFTDGGEVRSAARLIRPHEEWPMSAWSAESALVHGISLAALERADPAPEVARWLTARIEGRAVVSDSPPHDGRWMARLLATAPGLVMPRVHDFDVLVAARCTLEQAKRVYGVLDREPTPHRADADAARLARAWLAGRGSGR